MMQPLFGLKICRASFFWRVKQTKVYRFVIDLYACPPLAVFASDAGKSACVFCRFSPVMRISDVGSFAQINQSVVRAILVDVVNLICRPYAAGVKPRKAMRAAQNVVYTNADIPVLHQAPSHGTFTAFSPGYSPLKNPRIRVITDKFFQPFYGKLGHHMHSIAPFVYINAVAHGSQS